MLAFSFFVPVRTTLAIIHVETTVQEERIAPWQDIVLDVSVAWTGDADDYVVVAPKPVLPDGLHIKTDSFSSNVSDDHHRTVYRFVCEAERRGHYTITPIDVHYWSEGRGEKQVLLTEEISFTVSLLPGTNPRVVWTVAVGLLAAVAGAAVLALRKRRASAITASTDREPVSAGEVNRLLGKMKQHLLEGDSVAFFSVAAAAVQIICPDDASFACSITEKVQKIRFAGYAPTAEETGGILRRLELKAFEMSRNTMSPDPDQQLSTYCRETSAEENLRK